MFRHTLITTAAAVALTGAIAADAPAATYCVQDPECAAQPGAVVPKGGLQAALTQAAVSPADDRVQLGAGTFSAPTGFAYVAPGAGNRIELVGKGTATVVRTSADSVAGDVRVLQMISAHAGSRVARLQVRVPDHQGKGTTSGLHLVGVDAEDVEVADDGSAGESRADVGLVAANATLRRMTVNMNGGPGTTALRVEDTLGVTAEDAVLNGRNGVVAGGPATLRRTRVLTYGGTGILATAATTTVQNVVVTVAASGTGLRAQPAGKLPAAVHGSHVTVWAPVVDTGTAARASASATADATVLLDNAAIAGVDSALWSSAPGAGKAKVAARFSAMQHAGDMEEGAGEVMSTYGVDAEPQFVAAAAADLRLKPGSPGLDAGTPQPLGGLPATDLAGGARALDADGDGIAQPDAGAFEFAKPKPTAPPAPPKPPAAPKPPVSSQPAEPQAQAQAPAPVAADDGVRPAPGSAVPPAQAGNDTTAPAVTAVSVTRSRRLRFVLSEPARVAITVRRGRRVVRRLVRPGVAGRNVVSLSRPKRGRYAVSVVATDAAGLRSRTVTVRSRTR